MYSELDERENICLKKSKWLICNQFLFRQTTYNKILYGSIIVWTIKVKVRVSVGI